MQYSVVDYQSIVDASHSLRFDAEFFRPDYLQVQRRLEAIGSRKLIDFQVNIRHPKEIKRNYVDNGVLLLRGQNVRPLSIDLTANPVYISEEDAERLKENTIHYKDILIMRSGANVGQCAIYLEDSPAISMSDTLIIRSSILNPFFLAIFLNSRYGKALIERGKYGSAQPHIAPSFLYQIPVPNWEHLQTEIEKTYLQSKELTELSKTRYAETQTLLLSELGLADWQPKHTLAFATDYASMQRAERIDADYFQPKYDEIEKGIENYSAKSIKIRDEFKQNKSIFEIDPEKLYRYVEIGSVNVSTGEIVAEEVLGKDLPANAKRVLKKGDIIISKVRTYRGAITVIQQDGYVGSGAFCVLKENGQINKETLLACLRSKLFLTWSWKPNTGTSYPTLDDDDILDFPIPIPPKEKQAEIKQKVDESFNLRKHAKDLLECAKRAVEIAIEQDEQSAIDWLKSVSSVP
ncbi:MAG: restriction endonuclease subunit S [Candidatus Poribacteria bacterium]|nr:restriction endonuclease subunit S [Candidatus Poribacteria bacterium]